MTDTPNRSNEAELQQLRKRFERERRIRAEAESIAERATGDLYASLQQLGRLNEELDAANKAIRDFVSVASHDLRGPLSAILGFADVMRDSWDRLDDERKLEFLDIIHRQGSQLDRLVADLLTISKIDAGAVHAQIQAIRVDRMLLDAVHALGAESSGILVSVPDHEVQALADPDHLDRIVRNYLTNALKYGGPPIEARCDNADGWAEIRVLDHGGGIPEDLLPRLFEKFARGDAAEVRAKEGTGLGLSIVRGLARANGGDAWYEPIEPNGACFGVRLPKAG